MGSQISRPNLRITMCLLAMALTIRVLLALVPLSLISPLGGALELYDDFDVIYIKQLSSLSKGLVPYRDFAYSYPPLFLYSLFPFYAIGGPIAASIPIWISDAATSCIIYLIVKKRLGLRAGLAGGLIYVTSPFAVLYEGNQRYSSQPMTFFMVLSFYYLLNEKPLHSLISLVTAVLFKQEALFVLPVYALCYLKRFGKEVYIGMALASAFLGAVSLPFILICPKQFLDSLTFSIQGSTVYKDVVLLPIISMSLYGSVGFLLFSFIPQAILVLYAIRRNEEFLFLGSAFSLVFFIVIFSVSIHSVFRYYFLPAYVLILLAGTGKVTFTISSTAPLVSLILPPGPMQELFALLVIIAIVSVLDAQSPTRVIHVKRERSLSNSYKD